MRTPLVVVLSLVGGLAEGAPKTVKDVHVEGRVMRVEIAGEGSPAVVFASGIGDGLSSWRDVFPAVAAFTRAVAYDRPGYGGSASAPTPRTFTQAARDLRALLRAAAVPPPYVLVGHSLGGAHVRAFAHLFPAEVAGIVLVDPLSEDIFRALAPEEWQKEIREQDAAMANAPAGTVAEWSHLKDQAERHFPELQGFGHHPDVPFALLVAPRDRPPKWVATLLAQYGPWVAAASEATLTVAAGAGHYVHRDDPGVVIEAIRRVVHPSPERILNRALGEGGALAGVAAYRWMKARYPAERLNERLLNAAGYRALRKKLISDALVLFALNAEEHPASANVHDSLGEALAAAGKDAEAIVSYRKSLALDPANTNAAKALERLEAR